MKSQYDDIKKIGIINACKKNIIKKVKISCSGGKDSIATLLWAKQNIYDYVNIKVVFVNTKLEFNNIKKYIIDICNELNFVLEVRERNKEDEKNILNKFFEESLKIGIPFKIRYCEHLLKEPLYYIKEFDSDIDLTLIGNRWGESSKRADQCYLYIDKNKLYYNPILDLSSVQIYEFIKENKIPLYPSYKYLRRLSCSLCPNVFLRKNITSDIKYSLKNKKIVNWDFYNKWLENIKNCDKSKMGQVVLNRNLNFIHNYEIMNKMNTKNIKLKEIKKPVYEYYE